MWRLAFAGVLVLAASVYFVALVPRSVGLTPDSVAYLLAARNLAGGHGLSVLGADGSFEPLTRFPPVYPALLGALFLLKQNWLSVLWGLHFFLYIVNGLLMMALVQCSTGTRELRQDPLKQFPRRAALVSSALFWVHPAVLNVHCMAWSEPLFIFFLLLGAISIHGFSTGRSRLIFPVVLGILSGTAFLTRYAGVALGIAAGVWLLSLPNHGRQIRLSGILATSILGVLPMIWWKGSQLTSMGNSQFGNSGHVFGSREFGWHPPRLRHIMEGLETFGGWFVPLPADSVYLFLVGCLVVCVGTVFMRGCGRGEKEIARFWKIFCGIYLGVILLSKSFFDAEIPFNDRILCPILIAVLALISNGTNACSWKKRWTLVAMLGLVVMACVESPLFHQESWNRALFYAGSQWQSSPTMAAVATLAADKKIASNAPEAIQLLADRYARKLPSMVQAGSRKPNDDFGVQFMELIEYLEDGYIAYFYAVRWRSYLPNEEQLRAINIGSDRILAPMWMGDDGVIFQIRSKRNGK